MEGTYSEQVHRRETIQRVVRGSMEGVKKDNQRVSNGGDRKLYAVGFPVCKIEPARVREYFKRRLTGGRYIPAFPATKRDVVSYDICSGIGSLHASVEMYLQR